MNEKSIKKLITFLCFLVLFLIALGGSVRAMDAGLACPDWPLCFGKLIPDFHPQVYFEFIHRVVAGIVAILTFILGLKIFRQKNYPTKAKKIVCALGIILIVQIVMGGLTVLKLLHFGAVTLHLGLGIAFFGVLVGLHFLVTNHFPERDKKTPTFVIAITSTSVFVVFCQIILGGLVSSNYAGLACPDFPLCHGQWIPTLEGDVGLQVIHRLGAYFTFAYIYVCYLFLRTQQRKPWVKQPVVKSARYALSFVMLQIVVGMSNIIFQIPPIITVVHLAVAALILFFCLRMTLSSFYETTKS